ncbi:MAG: hypothetical protein PQJ50_12260, partial [Spirochaetales bacterium]|nr:hypothetical protein [Spirochaetales bacterium]
HFNEEISPEESTIDLNSGERAHLSVQMGNILSLKPEEDLIPGRQYSAALTVEDARGNSCRFVLPFWGWNPDLPPVLINELNPDGTETNPDCIELIALKGGNLAGLCLYYGTSGQYEYRYILPALQVEAGDYVIIHCRREYVEGEISEYRDRTLSTGKLSSDVAWDLWLPEDRGLSGANGILTIYNSPGGEIMDGIVYSDRTSDPEDDYLGWTSRTFDAAADLYDEGGWRFSSRQIPPEEAVYSGYTTATRSLCRSSDSRDSNSSADWHTVPTSSKSFGLANTDEVFIPPQ